MVGSATLTMVVSSRAIETPRMSTASAIHELRGVASGVSFDAAGAGELVTEVRLSEKEEPPRSYVSRAGAGRVNRAWAACLG